MKNVFHSLCLLLANCTFGSNGGWKEMDRHKLCTEYRRKVHCEHILYLYGLSPLSGLIHCRTRAVPLDYTMLKFFKNEQNKINAADEQLNDKKFDEIKVIGAGLPRTGTLSLKTALTQLYGGEEFWFNCVHPISNKDVWGRGCALSCENNCIGCVSFIVILSVYLLLQLREMCSLALMLIYKVCFLPWTPSLIT